MLENLKAVGVGTEHIQILKGVPTGIAMITVGDNDNTIIVVPGANGKVDRAYIDSIKSELEKFDMVVLQHEIPLETVHYVIEFCYEKGIKIVLNPAPAAAVPMEIIDKVTYVTPNEHEAVLIFGDKLSTEDLLRKYPEKLVITQGSRGVSTCLKDGRILNIPARKAQVVDTTGAGDTLNGAFSVQIAGSERRLKMHLHMQCGSKSVHRKIWSTDRNADRRRSRDRVKEIVRSAKRKRKTG